jgi:hypothetical protein
MGVVVWLSPNLVVSADTTNPVISIVSPPSQDGTASSGFIKTAVDNINSTIHINNLMLSNDSAVADPNFLTYNYDSAAKTVNITINMNDYNKLSSKNKQAVMQYALDGIYNSQISKTNRNKIYNALCKQDETTSSLVRQLSTDVTADFGHAYEYFKPFSGPLGVVLGIIAFVIFILLGFTLLLDIAYITLPFLQGWLTKTDGTARLVSIEATNAVKEQESKAGSEYVNPLGIYLKSKIKQYIAIFICLLYLLSGQIYTLLANFMDYFSGLLG